MRKRGFERVSRYGADIRLPERKTAASAGYDIEAAADVTIVPGATVLVPTGLKAYMHPGEVLMLAIRSSLAAKRGLCLANGIGVIDADYYDNPLNEGHIQVAIRNGGTEPVALAKGERIAQGLFLPYLTVDGDEAGVGAARTGGFGSTNPAEEQR